MSAWVRLFSSVVYQLLVWLLKWWAVVECYITASLKISENWKLQDQLLQDLDHLFVYLCSCQQKQTKLISLGTDYAFLKLWYSKWDKNEKGL
jgi:hypothetical protein